MSSARVFFFLILCAASCAWTTVVLLGQIVRLEHHGLVTAIRAHTATPERSEIVDAVAGYERTIRILPCNVDVHEDLLLLLAQQSDMDMESDVSAADATLEKTQNALVALLSCTPMDGKAWLDYATITAYREGFTAGALAAYKMSARVAPGESWLAEKRLLFALKFRPLLDADALAVAQHDLTVLDHAHPNRMTAVLKEAKVQSREELAATLFAVSGNQ